MNNITSKATAIDKLEQLAAMRSHVNNLAKDAAVELKHGSSTTALKALEKARDQKIEFYGAVAGDQVFDEINAEYAKCVKLLATI